MYSIYDYYTNDLENRYSSVNEKMSSAKSGTPNNQPFIDVIPTPTVPTTAQTNLLGDTGTTDILSDRSNTNLLRNQGTSSIYDMSEDTSLLPTRDDTWGPDYDWSKNPSPPVFDYLTDYLADPLVRVGAGFLGPYGPAVTNFYNLGKEDKLTLENYIKGLPGEYLNYAKGLGIGQLANKAVSALGIKNPLTGYIVGKGVKSGTNTLIDETINFLTGNLFGDKNPYQEPRGLLGRGVDYFTGRYDSDKRTIGSPTADPHLAVGPFTEPSYTDPGVFPYGNEYSDYGWRGSTEVPGGYEYGGAYGIDSGYGGEWGGPSGDWSGDAWGDSYY